MASIETTSGAGAGTEPGRQRRPRVTLSYAQSLDGSIAGLPRAPLAISGPEALSATHQLRASHDAILVGIGTVLADDPQLTVRFAVGQNPRPVIVDSQLRCPPEARCLYDTSRRPIIATLASAPADRESKLAAKGAAVVRLPTRGGGVELGTLLDWLGQQGIRTLMVEGGAGIITAFLQERLADQAVLTIATVFIGGTRAVSSLLAPDADNFPRLTGISWQPAGKDMIVTGTITHPQ